MAMKRSFSRRKKSCPFKGDNAPVIDYKNVDLLVRYVSDRGKIIPSRITSVSRKKQRELSRAIKRARMLALLPFAVTLTEKQRFKPEYRSNRPGDKRGGGYKGGRS